MPKIECGVDYFFFRRLVFFFAAAFFLFFAIAALLAMSGWRYRYSAVANRSALSSDYYSRKKIIVTPVDFVLAPRRLLPLATRRTFARVAPREKLFIPRDLSSKFPHVAEMPIKYGFLWRSIFSIAPR
jgi:hypothetical protein